MKVHHTYFAFYSFFLLAAFFSGCAAISQFSPAAYEQATSLKVESLALMDRAAEPFEKHRSEEEGSTISRPFIEEAKGIVSDAVDTIIGLEGGKVNPRF